MADIAGTGIIITNTYFMSHYDDTVTIHLSIFFKNGVVFSVT